MIAGRVTALAIDSNDETGNTVYAGGAFGGVWKSTNAATLNAADVDWQPLTDDQDTLAIGALAVQPRTPQGPGTVVLAGTGETNSAIDSYYGLGILRSPDQGASWSLISQDQGGHSFVGLGFSRIVFSKANPNLVVAAAAGTSQGGIDGLAVTANLGIYFSIDAGSTWTRAVIRDGGTPIAPASVTSIAYLDASQTFVASVRGHGFYSSADGGLWLRLGQQPGGTLLGGTVCPPLGASGCPIYRGELAAVPGRNEIYAWYVDGNNTDMGIWRSFNGGSSWEALNDTGISACGDQNGCGTEDGAYNLALAVVPDGLPDGFTNIYAGAANIYKCRSVGPTSDCSGSDGRPFLNLTHAYGCPAGMASTRVYPSQHAIEFLQVAANTQVVMYFANDGGVYRSLDGYLGLVNGECDQPNNFDNINQHLGSLAQVISLAQHPTDPNIVFTGTNGSGFPVGTQALSIAQWQSVNAGGGYVAIDPLDPDNWFTANGASSVQHCPFGSSCRSDDFSSRQIVSSAVMGGDVGPPYLPFLLDPEPGALIAGTCRVWRGQTDGNDFSPLSVNFETGSDAGCSGLETNQVRALAAFQTGSFPEIIYAGTDGFGPLVTSGPVGGHVWVSDPADTNTWIDRTGTINPKHFPVSAVAIDPFDPTTDPTSGTAGQVAYVAITGYGSGNHVWKTVNGGITWKSFDGLNETRLPDVPVNALIIDKPPGESIYAGTDRGVYVSKTNDVLGASWTLIGAASRKLPNLPVMALGIFDDGTTQFLRAATYGRGVWQFLLSTAEDFRLAIDSRSQTVLAGQTAHFAGQLEAINGYSKLINLSCTPAPCTVSPMQISGSGATFNVTIPGTGDKTVILHAVGTDAKPVSHDVSLQVRILDYAMTALTPSALAVRRGDRSSESSFQVSATSAFNETVGLSCLNLPAGASCDFTPSDEVQPGTGPIVVKVAVVAALTTPINSFPVVVDAAALGLHRQATLTLNVVSGADYRLNIDQSTLTAKSGETAKFNLNVAAIDGYNSQVALKCGTGAPPMCSISPAAVMPTPAGAPVEISVRSDQPATYAFAIMGTTTDSPPVNHSVNLSFQVTQFDFTAVNTSGPLTVRAGDSADFSISLTPTTGTFPEQVSLGSCSGIPPLSTCVVAPAQFSGGARTVTLTVTTTAPVLASVKHGGWTYAVLLMGVPLIFVRRRGGLLLAVFLATTLVSCGGGGLSGGGGGGGHPGTEPGDYAVGVTATCGGVSRTVILNLKVT
jgi:hypothetical protein